MDSVFLVIPVLIILMFSLGLELAINDFTQVLRFPKSLLVGLIGQVLILPGIAFAIAGMFDIAIEYKIGLVLIACCPGGLSSNVFTMLAKGNIALSVVLTAITSFLSIISVPLILGLAISIFSDETTSIRMPFGMIVGQSFVMVFVPIVLGMILKRLRPAMAQVLGMFLKRAAMPLLLIVVIAFAIEKYDDIQVHLLSVSVVVILLLVLAMATGFFMAKISGLCQSDRKSIIIEIGLQNAALAITIASSSNLLANKTIAIPAIVYALIMNIVVILYIFSGKVIKGKTLQ